MWDQEKQQIWEPKRNNCRLIVFWFSNRYKSKDHINFTKKGSLQAPVVPLVATLCNNTKWKLSKASNHISHLHWVNGDDGMTTFLFSVCMYFYIKETCLWADLRPVFSCIAVAGQTPCWRSWGEATWSESVWRSIARTRRPRRSSPCRSSWSVRSQPEDLHVIYRRSCFCHWSVVFLSSGGLLEDVHRYFNLPYDDWWLFFILD